MIRVTNVSKRYKGDNVALKDISFKVNTGELVYLIGKSGSGKSTLLKILGGEELPTDGSIRVGKYEIKRTSALNYLAYRRDIGIVFQDFRLLQNKNVFENISYRLEILGVDAALIREKVTAVLKMVDLLGKETSFPHELSGGEEQRVGIARAIVTKPKLLLVDEPTANLDVKNALRIMSIFENISKTGTTVLMATHDSVLVNKKPHRVLELKKGELVRDEEEGTYNNT